MKNKVISPLFFVGNEKRYVSKISLLSIFIFPILIVPVVSIFLFIPKTQNVTLSLLKENNLVETLTFIFLLFGSILGFILAKSAFKKEMEIHIWMFIALFAFSLFIIAMEEIAWGQQLFKFETPETFKKINAQGELTLHNINSLQGKSEYFRIIFGFLGIIGIYLAKYSFFKTIAPPKILISFFAVIFLVTLIDLYADYFTIHKNLDVGLQRISELIEMLIGLASFIYMYLLRKTITYEDKN